MMTNRKLLQFLSQKPELYAPSSAKFWDDEHISKGMLKAHLDPNLESATRKLAFVHESASWIASMANPIQRPRLLDLGCGPGIYAEFFAEEGFDVTGIDMSLRSIDYAKQSAQEKELPITYLCQNYLDMDYDQEFDVVTLIYCDFGVLSEQDRKNLLGKIHKALKPNGVLIFDVCTPKQFEDYAEISNWSYSNGGYWSPNPHACLYSFYRYTGSETIVQQYVIVEAESVRCYNIWNHGFTTQELQADLERAGFKNPSFWGNIAGQSYSDDNLAICTLAHK